MNVYMCEKRYKGGMQRGEKKWREKKKEKKSLQENLKEQNRNGWEYKLKRRRWKDDKETSSVFSKQKSYKDWGQVEEGYWKELKSCWIGDPYGEEKEKRVTAEVGKTQIFLNKGIKYKIQIVF